MERGNRRVCQSFPLTNYRRTICWVNCLFICLFVCLFVSVQDCILERHIYSFVVDLIVKLGDRDSATRWAAENEPLIGALKYRYLHIWWRFDIFILDFSLSLYIYIYIYISFSFSFYLSFYLSLSLHAYIYSLTSVGNSLSHSSEFQFRS